MEASGAAGARRIFGRISLLHETVSQLSKARACSAHGVKNVAHLYGYSGRVGRCVVWV